jgi:Fe2+ transport system protein B
LCAEDFYFFVFFPCGVRVAEDFVLFCELGKLVHCKMNDSDVSKQVQQMVHFIKQEAEEKANEISVAAEEEFNIEKLQLVEAEKKKIKQEYERKEKQVDVRKKIEYSTQLNASRLKVLQAQDDLIRKMKEAAEKQLRSVSSQADDYARLLEALIIQVCFSLWSRHHLLIKSTMTPMLENPTLRNYYDNILAPSIIMGFQFCGRVCQD